MSTRCGTSHIFDIEMQKRDHEIKLMPNEANKMQTWLFSEDENSYCQRMKIGRSRWIKQIKNYWCVGRGRHTKAQILYTMNRRSAFFCVCYSLMLIQLYARLLSNFFSRVPKGAWRLSMAGWTVNSWFDVFANPNNLDGCSQPMVFFSRWNGIEFGERKKRRSM